MSVPSERPVLDLCQQAAGMPLAIIVDTDPLLCELRSDCEVHFPWLDASEFWMVYSEIRVREPRIGDVRDLSAPIPDADVGKSQRC